MAKRWSEAKGPGEVLDYRVDWSQPLAGDIIASASWSLPAGITGGLQSHTDSTTTIRLSGGADGADYSLLNRITTLIGRTFDLSCGLRVRAK